MCLSLFLEFWIGFGDLCRLSVFSVFFGTFWCFSWFLMFLIGFAAFWCPPCVFGVFGDFSVIFGVVADSLPSHYRALPSH